MMLAHVTAQETSLIAGLLFCGITIGVLVADRVRIWLRARPQK